MGLCSTHSRECESAVHESAPRPACARLRRAHPGCAALIRPSKLRLDEIRHTCGGRTACAFERFSLQFPLMKVAPEVSTAQAVRGIVLDSSSERFFTRDDFEGSVRAIEVELSRLVSQGELLRVRRGLYWRGRATRFGMTRPGVLQTALEVAGPGSGPTGISAAHFLGLSTQSPSVVEIAVPGRAPAPMNGVKFSTRPYDRIMAGVTPAEVAFIEVLRDPTVLEASIREFRLQMSRLAANGTIRFEVVQREVASESSVAARELLGELALVA